MKRLDLTGIVYVLFLGMCILGVRAWVIAYREQHARLELDDEADHARVVT